MAQPPESPSAHPLPEDQAAPEGVYTDDTLTAASDHYVRIQAAEQPPVIPNYATPERVEFFRELMADETASADTDPEARVSGSLRSAAASAFLTPPRELDEPEPAPPMRRPQPNRFKESDLWAGEDGDKLLHEAKKDLGKLAAFFSTAAAQPPAPVRPARAIGHPDQPRRQPPATQLSPRRALPSFGGANAPSAETTQLMTPVAAVSRVNGAGTAKPS